MTTADPAGRERTRARRIWRWALLLYAAGILLDFLWHVQLYLTTGDRRIELHEWIIGLQASLFWPVDLLTQVLRAVVGV